AAVRRRLRPQPAHRRPHPRRRGHQRHRRRRNDHRRELTGRRGARAGPAATDPWLPLRPPRPSRQDLDVTIRGSRPPDPRPSGVSAPSAGVGPRAGLRRRAVRRRRVRPGRAGHVARRGSRLGGGQLAGAGPGRALESVLAQDYDGELCAVVVFDRAEPDMSLAGDRVEVMANSREPGLAGARNTGILALDTDLIAFCDDDDQWLPGKIAAQAKALEAEPDAVLCSTGIVIDFDGRELPRLAGTDRVT